MMIFDRYRNKSKRQDEKTTLKKSSLANSFLKKFPIHLTKIGGWNNRQTDDHKATSTINQPRPSTSLPNIPLTVTATTAATSTTSTTAAAAAAAAASKKPLPTPGGRRGAGRKAPHKSKSLVLPPTNNKKRHSAEPRKRLALTSNNSIRHSYTFGHLTKNASKLTIADLELDEKQKACLDKLIESAKTCPRDPQELLSEAGSRKKPTPHRSISHQHLTIQPVRQSLNRAHSDSHAKSKQLGNGQAINSEDLVELLRESHDSIILIDVRNLMDYQKSHIRGSFNVNLPSLLVKRYQRGTVSNFNIENFITTPEGRTAYTDRIKENQDSNNTTTTTTNNDNITPTLTVPTINTTSTTISTSSSILEQKAALAEQKKNNRLSMQQQQQNNTHHNHNNSNIWVIYDDEMAEDDLTTQAWTLVHVMERFIGDSGLIYYLKDGFQAFEEEDWLESTEPPSNSSNAGIVQNNPTLLNIPRRSVSYTIGESKNDLHRRTSLFSLDTQAARVNNANALARRANRRSQQVKKSEEIIPPAVALNQVSEDDEAVALMTDASPRTETEFGFVISEIIPGFLYVGPEVETVEQANQLDDRKIKRILNMAEECNDDVEGLKERMVYRKISARDTVEMKNIELVIMEAVQFIEEAKKHHEPTYVHCKAGKSRSITAILAYLVTSELWTLKRAYRHVIKARPNMSPNIGFISELMKIEGRVHGRISSFMETDWQSTSLPSPEYANELLVLENAWKPNQEHILVQTE